MTLMKSKVVLDIKEQKLKQEVILPEVTDRKHHLSKFYRENYKDQVEKLHQPPKEKSIVLSTRSSF